MRIGWLMLAIALIAVGVAGLRNASDAWEAAILALTVAVLAFGAARSLTTRCPERRFWIGFVVLGGSYLAIAGVPRIEPKLPSSPWLDRLHPLICAPKVARTVIPRSAFDESYSAFAEGHPDVTDVRLVFDEDGDNTATIIWGVPTLSPFRRIGHCMIALGSAVIGGCALRLIAPRSGRSGLA